MCIIDNITELAEKKGVSQTFICDSLGKKRNYLFNLKRTNKEPSDSQMAVIANVLNTSVAYLKGETDDPSPQKEKSPSNDGLSENERVMLQLFRTVPEDRQTELLSLIESALKMNGLLQ